MELFSLIASLPALRLFEEPGISSEEFMECCASRFRGPELELLQALSLVPSGTQTELVRRCPEKSLPRRYAAWECALRNSLAGLRASKWKHGEPGPSRRLDGGYEADADLCAKQAAAASDPLERERILDQARWRKLEELERAFSRHMFSFDAVCAYRLKLRIAEKWTMRKAAGAVENLDRTALSVQNSEKQTE